MRFIWRDSHVGRNQCRFGYWAATLAVLSGIAFNHTDALARFEVPDPLGALVPVPNNAGPTINETGLTEASARGNKFEISGNGFGVMVPSKAHCPPPQIVSILVTIVTPALIIVQVQGMDHITGGRSTLTSQSINFSISVTNPDGDPLTPDGLPGGLQDGDSVSVIAILQDSCRPPNEIGVDSAVYTYKK